MASKSLDKPITKADLEEFIKTQDDFALELYVYSLARRLGFTSIHAGSYSDRITGKTRQFDVRASRSCGEDMNVYLAIECKCLRPSFPLLISQIPRTPSESFQDVMQADGVRKTQHGQIRVVGPRVVRLDGAKSIYRPYQYVGKALVQVGYNEAGRFIANDHEVFDKWGQAIASVNGLIREAAYLQVPSGMSQRSVALPVLVVPDGSLWIANYSENGSLQDGPEQVDEVQFFIGDGQTYAPNLDRLYTVSHLHVVTKSGLNNLLESFLGGGANMEHLIDSLQIS
jgi:hypothetical protein